MTINLEPMNVAMVDFTEEFANQTEILGAEDHPDSDWSLLLNHATFNHKEACEFILYTEYEDTWYKDTVGFSDKLREIINEAKNQGYKYVCIYA
jgi:hypothetical protein